MRVQFRVFGIPIALVILACGPSPETEKAAREEAPAPAAVITPASALAAPEFVVAPQHRPSEDVEFRAVLDLDQPGGQAQSQVRGGRVAASKDWPASLYTTFTTPDGTAACTAALIGPQAMLTAAHCVPMNGIVRFRYKDQQPYLASCTQHPEYVNNKDASADYALCKIDRPVTVPNNRFKYETVSTSSMNRMLNKGVILTGYGCVSDIVQDNQTDGQYRFGFNTIDETSASTDRRRPGPYYSGEQDNNLFTRDDPALANLCPGDSGGPAFGRTGGQGQLTSRVIVGVNSRVFYRDESMNSYGSSLISATGGPDFRAWALEWARNAGVAACGLRGELINCRS